MRCGLIGTIVFSGTATRGDEPDSWRDSRRCGVNVVYSLLRLEGFKVPYEAVLKSVEITDRGTTIQKVSQTLTRFGMTTSIVKANPDELIGMPFPCIAHVEIQTPNTFSYADRGHFVVLLQCSNNSVLYLDGTTGIIQEITFDEFTRMWTGYLVIRENSQVWLVVYMIGLGTCAALAVREVRRFIGRTARNAKNAVVPAAKS
ncbi:MAG: cysteine peptidase family C39 domain-containing protein [Planctomycetota bacterium]